MLQPVHTVTSPLAESLDFKLCASLAGFRVVGVKDIVLDRSLAIGIISVSPEMSSRVLLPSEPHEDPFHKLEASFPLTLS